jgi:hypothetical protein
VLGDRKDMRALGLAVPAGDAGEPMRDVGDLTSSGDGSSRSSRRPDSMRCQAREETLRDVGLRTIEEVDLFSFCRDFANTRAATFHRMVQRA